jgi:hypothetical protein
MLIFDQAQELVTFVLFNSAIGLMTPDLLIECIKQLLTGRGTCIGRSVLKSSAKAAETE